MKITVLSSKSVKPAYGHESSESVACPNAVVPLSVFDKVNYDEYAPGIYAFHPPAPPNAALDAGLARALVDYREWAGRFAVDDDGSRSILLNDAGARLVEATAAVALAGVLPLDMGPEVACLFPYDGDRTEELLLVQLTRFACGSLVVGVNFHHGVADGTGMVNLLLAWGQATRGVPIDPVPEHDRASFFTPRDQPRVEFEHRGVEFKRRGTRHRCRGDGHGVDAGDEVVIHRVHFSKDTIFMLKSQASSGSGTKRRFTTVHCVVAHLWRCITAARRLDGLQVTKLHIAVNGRWRMRPKVPAGYTGNVVLWAWPATTAQELADMPLGRAVELISREIARIDDRYFRSFIDFASSGAVEREQLVPTADSSERTLSPNVEVDSMLGIPVDDLDFGSGRPFFFIPNYSHMAVDGVIYLVPSYEGSGSIDAYVPLIRRNMDAFKKCCYSLLPVAEARL